MIGDVLLDGIPMSGEDINPKHHKYVGMFRRPFDTFLAGSYPHGVVACTCGSNLWTVRQSREHWQMGHWDVPQYETIKENRQ